MLILLSENVYELSTLNLMPHGRIANEIPTYSAVMQVQGWKEASGLCWGRNLIPDSHPPASTVLHFHRRVTAWAQMAQCTYQGICFFWQW